MAIIIGPRKTIGVSMNTIAVIGKDPNFDIFHEC